MYHVLYILRVIRDRVFLQLAEFQESSVNECIIFVPRNMIGTRPIPTADKVDSIETST